MSLLSAHFEQIAICCQGIDSLPFPPPKIFTNALLSNHDITSLIRDTEAHERALFSVPPPPPPASAPPTATTSDQKPQSSRRQTVFNVASGEVMTSGSNVGRGASSISHNPRRNTAVAAVLGGDLHDKIRRTERRVAAGSTSTEVDVDVLLRGAEKLCGVYPLPGALERIPTQRSKYAQALSTLAYYEAKVTEQAEHLATLNKDHWREEEEEDDGDAADGQMSDEILTEDDLRQEEEEVRELDKKKRELQERLRTMDKDLGGLLNM